jgi:hypothetical protein
MRTLAGLLVLALSAAPAHAALVTVPDTLPDLSGVAATMAELMVDAGLPLNKASEDSYTVEAKNLHCDFYGRDALSASDPLAGLPTGQCRIDADDRKDTKAGKPFPEAHALTDIFSAVQNSASGRTVGLHLLDCASGGYCAAFAQVVRCTVNTSVKTLDTGGRWICIFVDGR